MRLGCVGFGILELSLGGFLGLGCLGFGFRLFSFLDLLPMVLLPISNRHIKPLEGDTLPGLPIEWPFLKIKSSNRCRSFSLARMELEQTGDPTRRNPLFDAFEDSW